MLPRYTALCVWLALLGCTVSPSPCTDQAHLQRLYVTMYPCNECAKLLIQAGITEVIFAEVSLSAAAIHAASWKFTSI